MMLYSGSTRRKLGHTEWFHALGYFNLYIWSRVYLRRSNPLPCSCQPLQFYHPDQKAFLGSWTEGLSECQPGPEPNPDPNLQLVS
jgi:hypothetical protein